MKQSAMEHYAKRDDLKADHKLIMIMLAFKSGDLGVCRIPLSLLAICTGISAFQLKRRMLELEKVEEVTVMESVDPYTKPGIVTYKLNSYLKEMES